MVQQAELGDRSYSLQQGVTWDMTPPEGRSTGHVVTVGVPHRLSRGPWCSGKAKGQDRAKYTGHIASHQAL